VNKGQSAADVAQYSGENYHITNWRPIIIVFWRKRSSEIELVLWR